MSMKGSISRNSSVGNAITKNTGVKFNGTTDGYWKRGMSAYEVAVAEGFQGTKSEWLDSLHGRSVAIASIEENDKIVKLTFSDGNTVTIRHGAATEFTVSSDNKIYWKYTNTNTWNELVDMQSIIDTTLTNRMTNYAKVYYGTTEEWNSRRDLISELCSFYVYTDHTNSDGEQKPAIKIGDGQAFLIDLPFITTDLSELIHRIDSHINNSAIHVSEQDREFWNNKCSVIETDVSDEHLIFTIN